jgi:hypothetical protein
VNKTTKANPRKGIPIPTSDEDYAEAARNQKTHLREAADRLERGESLDGMNKWLLAWALRNTADYMSEKEKRPAGQPPRIDPGGLALEFASMIVLEKMGVNEAHDALALRHGISIPAIKKSLEKHRDEALRLIGGPSLNTETKKRKLVTSKQ